MVTSEHPAPFDGKAFTRDLTSAPGVYRMYAADDTLLYVGKAASLNKRVASYFNKALTIRIATMVGQIARIDVTVTRTPAEALILENQLIKTLKPRYNVMLRDDKSYPYVLLTQEEFPRIALHRGPRAIPGKYYGPYPSAYSVRETLNFMHRLFKLRNCEDSVFRNRTRPCLQYQIGRCTAPCVGLIDATAYARDAHRAELFLSGRSEELGRELTAEMEAASERLDFEGAARLRDLLSGVRKLQSPQSLGNDGSDTDVLACVLRNGHACVMQLSWRDGRNLGTRAFFPKLNGEDSASEVLAAFVSQYYGDHPPPNEVWLDQDIPERGLIEEALNEASLHKVRLRTRFRGERAAQIDFVRRNADAALSSELASNAAQKARLDSLCELLGLDSAPQRIECYDISHTMGEATVASCVVFDQNGPVRGQYRRFNITGITPGDDYAAMHQVLTRRFKRAMDSLAAGETPANPIPDLLLIDGGVGQLAQARAVLNELDVQGLAMIGVAKGEQRIAGDETLVFPDGRELHPGKQSPGLQLIQQVRDEAHRFAITGHRGRRQKARTTSRLEDIPGIGPRRRASLLKHFGGMVGLKAAGVADIARVEGVNAALAERIYAALHGLA
ncbi:uvrC: excinuclease ABC subunit C [Lysobacter silvestris]|uniref:UvrABC system protein C n=1 Tax=Solilutibacter silvestris TaxID=1645665 RepID=A0A2K1PYG4_9GAMM|nr:uvrC: excinuclease ABC subunit C [Lysobacter silvestris]